MDDRFKRCCIAFEEFWNLGLLELSQEGEKYFVMCNEQNNPRHSLDAGYINVEVRLQPVGTTEQILIDFTIGWWIISVRANFIVTMNFEIMTEQNHFVNTVE